MKKRTRRLAADWFVHIDSGRDGAGEEAAFADWIARDPENEAAFARCGAAVGLARGLRGDPELRSVYAEVAAIAADAAPLTSRATLAAWLARPAPAWTVAALALAVAAAAWWLSPPGAPAALPALVAVDSPAPPGAVATPSPPAPRGASRALEVPSPNGTTSAVMLPGRVIVDARSLAVLPFELAADTPEAPRPAGVDDLYALVVERLAAIPGFYVLRPESAEPFATGSLGANEIATQLGVRAVVEARVAIEGQDVRVDLRLTDAARSTLLLDDAYVRSVDELGQIESDIVDNIALAMTQPDTSLFSSSERGITP